MHKRTAYEAATGLDLFNVGAKVMGVLGEEYLVKLRQDTHRGLRGRVERGLSGGGLPYGYRSEPIHSGRTNHRGEPIPDGYRWVPNPEQAPIVRRIFEQYVNGWGCGRLAHQLNADKVPPPRPRSAKKRGGAWSMTALRELLRNPIYRGEYIWNRSEWIKDHETGKRRRYARPESEWLRKHDESWRIVSDDLWDRAQKTAQSRSDRLKRNRDGSLCGSTKSFGGRPQYILSGALSCGICSGGFHVLHAERWGCGRRRTCGAHICSNDLRVDRSELEGRIISAIQTQILVPENVLYAIDKAFGIVREQTEVHDAGADEARLEVIGKEQENLARLAARTGKLDACGQILEELEQERDEILARLSAGTESIDLESYREQIEAVILDVKGLLLGAPDEGRQALRMLLDGERLRVYPDEARRFRVEGTMTWPVDEAAPGPRNQTGRCYSVVAGTGFEPVTFEL